MSVAAITPPLFPAVGERRLPGAKLWLVETPGTGQVTIRVSTRRGNDGAYDEENMAAMVLTVQEMLKAHLPGYEVNPILSAQVAALEVEVRSADAVSALQAIGEVLDGPIDEALARQFLTRSHHSLQPADLLRPNLFHLSNEPLVFRAADALELCRDERFSSSDRLITLVGDFDTSEIIAAGVEAFSSAHEMPRAEAGELSLIRVERVSLTQFTDSFTVALTLGAPGPRHPHYDVFNLMLAMAEEPLPIIPADNLGGPPPVVSTALNNERPGAIAFLAVGGAASQAETLLEGLFRYYRELITRPFTARSLAHARRLHWASIQAELDRDPTDILVGAFIRHLIPSQLEARFEALEELTPELLLDMTRYYFAPGRIILFVAGPRYFLQSLIVRRNGNGFRLRVDPPRRN
ncbi:MAG: hypothetical protein ACI9KE_000972 [Polyangiales bacterium]|jgi:hypothetical protein